MVTWPNAARAKPRPTATGNIINSAEVQNLVFEKNEGGGRPRARQVVKLIDHGDSMRKVAQRFADGIFEYFC